MVRHSSTVGYGCRLTPTICDDLRRFLQVVVGCFRISRIFKLVLRIYSTLRSICPWAPVLMAAVVSAGSTSFSFFDRFKNTSVHHPPTKYPESNLVQILLYLRASRMTKQAQLNSILAIIRSAGIVLTSVAATDFSSPGSCRFCWFHQFQFHLKVQKRFRVRFFGCRFQLKSLPIRTPA